MDAINSNTKRSYRHRRKWGAGGKKAFEKGGRSGGQEAFIELFNRLAAQYGAAATDFMVGNSVTPFAFLRLTTLIQDDLDLWFEATGQRVSQFIGAERQALECWLWETHDRSGRILKRRPRPEWELECRGGRIYRRLPDGELRELPSYPRLPDRCKPEKSSKQDAPWPGARNWSPRRWFGPGQSAPPLQISITGALDGERALLRATLAGEVRGDWDGADNGWLSDQSVEPLAERNHPKPRGFWGPGGFLGS